MSKLLGRFVAVGVVSAACYFVLAFLAQKGGDLSPWLSSGVAYLVTFSGTYLVQRKWTFRTSVDHRKSLPRYFVTQMLSMLLTMALMRAYAILFPNASALLASGIATVIAGAGSFILSSRWVFANAKQNAE